MAATAVLLEVGKKRVFACALDWPGWTRAGKDEALALEALAVYVPRYAAVPEQAGIAFPDRVGERLEVVERLPGDASTEFGVPGAIADADAARTTRAQAERLAALQAAGARRVFLWPLGDEPAQLERFRERVLPLVPPRP
jgi:hypothetical protein